MSKTMTRRIVAGASAAAVAAGMAVTMGAGAAVAAPATVDSSAGSWGFSRTVDNTTLKPGDIIEVTNNVRWGGGLAPTISAFKEVHDVCLTYIEGTGKVNSKGVSVENGTATDPYTKLTGSWIRSAVNRNIDYSLSYRVGESCARDTPLKFAVHVGANQGLGANGSDNGPSVTIAKNVTSVNLEPVVASEVGVPVNLTANVRGSANGDRVGFVIDGQEVGAGHTDANGNATFRWTPQTAGQKSIVAKFGATSFAVASESAARQVNVSAEAASVNSSVSLNAPVDARVGIAIPLTATVSPAGAGGSVTFFEGGTQLAQVPVGSDSTATYAYQATTPGAHTITAKFSGRDGVRGSEISQSFEVAPKASGTTDTTTVLTAPANGTVGQPAELKVQVTGASTGTVTFKDGQQVIAVVDMQSNGFASTMWTPAADGPRTITAEFSGSDTINGSAAAKTVQVAPAPVVDPGPGPGPGDGGNGGTGSLGSLGGLFGSLGG